MAISFPDFPDPSITQEWYNTATDEWYDWNDKSQAWRRRSAAEGGGGPLVPDPDGSEHQDGTLDDRYVEVGGDTMTGPLVQHLGDEDLYPAEEGDMSTVGISNEEIEFRYMGDDGTVRCGSLDLTTCVSKTNPVIENSGASVVADYDDILSLASAGTVSGATLSSESWQNDSAGYFVDTGDDPNSAHTVSAADQGLSYRVRQTFIHGESGEEFVLFSNVIAVTNEDPPVPTWFGWASSEPIEFETDLGANAKIYKLNGGTWTEYVEVPAGNGVVTPIDSSGTFVIDSGSMTHFRFHGKDGSETSCTLTVMDTSYTDSLTSMYASFLGFELFDESITWMNLPLVTTFGYCFKNCKSYNSNVDGLITSNIVSIESMFTGCAKFNQPVNSWDVSNVTKFGWVFHGCVEFNQPTDNWNTAKGETFQSAFQDCKKFDQSVNHFNFSSATRAVYFLRGCSVFDQPVDWTFVSDLSIDGLFWDCVNLNSEITIDFSQVKKITNIFRNCRKLNHPSLSNLDVSNATDITRMFMDCVALTQDLSSYDVSKCEKFEQTFKGCSVFNSDISNWNTSSAKSLRLMFSQATVFNQPIGKWDTSNVTTLYGIFYYAKDFNQANINNWNVSKVEDYYEVFAHMHFNQPLDKWNTVSATSMLQMFNGANQFNQDISMWCVPNITEKPDDFDANTPIGFRDNDAKQPQWGTCPPSILTHPVIK